MLILMQLKLHLLQLTPIKALKQEKRIVWGVYDATIDELKDHVAFIVDKVYEKNGDYNTLKSALNG